MSDERYISIAAAAKAVGMSRGRMREVCIAAGVAVRWGGTKARPILKVRMSEVRNYFETGRHYSDKYSTYFVQTRADGPIKIGRARDLKKRLCAATTFCPDPIVCLGYLYGNREAEMHARFASLRLRGEWFKPAPELLAFITTETRKWTE